MKNNSAIAFMIVAFIGAIIGYTIGSSANSTTVPVGAVAVKSQINVPFPSDDIDIALARQGTLPDYLDKKQITLDSDTSNRLNEFTINNPSFNPSYFSWSKLCHDANGVITFAAYGTWTYWGGLVVGGYAIFGGGPTVGCDYGYGP